MGKPRGIRAGRKLHVRNRTQRWADKQYNKAHLSTKYTANPFGGASMAKGIVLEKVYVAHFLLFIFLFKGLLSD